MWKPSNQLGWHWHVRSEAGFERQISLHDSTSRRTDCTSKFCRLCLSPPPLAACSRCQRHKLRLTKDFCEGGCSIHMHVCTRWVVCFLSDNAGWVHRSMLYSDTVRPNGTERALSVYIYIYAFSRRFYLKRLTLHSSYSFNCLCRLCLITPYRLFVQLNMIGMTV